MEQTLQRQRLGLPILAVVAIVQAFTMLVLLAANASANRTLDHAMAELRNTQRVMAVQDTVIQEQRAVLRQQQAYIWHSAAAPPRR